MEKAKILIVEDEGIVTLDLRNQLRRLGYVVPAVAVSGETAIKKTAKVRPDLVLMDIKLKGTMDGVDAAEEIRRRFDIPVIYLTAYADDETLQRAKITRPFGYILKPFDEKVLHSTVEMALYGHRMERKLRESEARYRAVVEDQTEFICRFQPNGTLTFVNQAYRRYFHKEPGELIGHGIMPLILEEDRELVRERFASLSRDHPIVNYEHRVVMPDGEIRWQEWTDRAVFDQAGDLVEYQSVGRDVTERKQMEKTLRRRAEELAALQATVLDVTVEHDLPTLLETIVERAAQLLDAPAGGMYLCDPEREEARCVASYNTPDDYTDTVLKYGEGAAGTVAQTEEPLIIDDYRTWDRRSAVYEKDQPFTAVLSAPMTWQGEVTGVIHVLRNVEARRFTQADLELLTLFANHAAIAVENARLYEETRQRATQLEALREVGLEITAQLDLEKLLHSIASQAIELLGGVGGGLYLYRPGQDALEFVTTVGRQAVPRGSILQRGEGLSGKVWESGEPLIVDDYRHWEKRAPQYEGLPIETVVGVPVRWGEEFLGVLTTDGVASRPFSSADAELLSLFATQAAIAIRNARLYEETERRATQARLIYEVGQHVSSELEPDVLLSTIVSAVRDAFNYHNVILLLLDERTDRLTTQSIAGAYADILPDDLSLAVGEGMIGHAAATGEIQISNDVSTHPHYVRKATEDTQSELAVPIKSGQKVIGVLDLQDDERNAFDEIDVTTLETLSTQIATAIENARLFQAERRRSTQLATVSQVAESITSTLDPHEVLHRTVELITQTFGYYYASIMLLDPEIGDLVCEAGAGGLTNKTPPDFRQKFKEGMIGWAAHLGEAMLANDVNQEPRYISAYLTDTRSELDVPLKYRDQVIGVLDLQSRELNAFDEHDVMAMEVLAGHVAAAIENARLYEETQQRTAQLEALQEIALAISAQLDLDELLHNIVAWGCRLLDIGGGSLYLVDEESGDLEQVVSHGYKTDRTGTRMAPGEGVAGKVLQRGEPLAVDDYSDWEGRSSDWEDEEITASLGVPLKCGERIIGTVGFDEIIKPRKFDERDIWLATLFANQAAIAIENAQLFEETQQRALEQKTLRESALTMTTALERNAVLERILAQLQEVVPYDTASIQLLRDDLLKIVGGRGFPNLEELLGFTFDPHQTDNPNREVVRTQATFIVKDAPTIYEEFRRAPHAQADIHSWLGVPMLVGDQMIGMIALDKQERGFYTEEHARLAETFAAQAAVAIENARLFQAEREQREFSERLRKTALLVSSSLDLQEVLEMILDQLACVIHYNSGSIQILEEGATRVIATQNLPSGELGRRYPLHEFPYNRRLVEEGTPIVIDDVTKYSQGWVKVEGLEHVRANIGVPLQVRDEVIGILTIDNCHPDTYTEDDARQIETFAQQAAVTIENARLFQAEREQRELAEALEEASAAVSSALDLDEVLDRILEQVARVVDADAFNIMLVENSHARVVRSRGYERFGTEDLVSSINFDIPKVPNLQHMSESGKPLIIEDTTTYPGWVNVPTQRWLRSYVGVPIQVGGITVGFLNVDSSEPGHFDSDATRQLEAFASHAATAIENARLYERLRDHAETLEEEVAERTAQLRAQFAQLEAILNSTVNGIVVTGVDGELILANPVARTWLNQTLSPEEADQLRETVRDLAARAERQPRKVLELIGLDLELSAAPIAEPDIKGAKAVVAIHDVSHLKALDRMKSRFVSSVSHELRTPIATIKLYAHLMRTQPERWREYLEPLTGEANHQAQLVEDILEISRVDAGRLELKPRPTDLSALIDILIENHNALIQERELTLERRTAETGPTALLDPQRIMQVLNNLMSNAIRYTPEGGSVTVATDEVEAKGRVWATVTVKDTGMGIPEEELPHLFDRFFRGERPRVMQMSGTGLGLAIVKEIVSLHGGRVTVESQVDEGSTFTVWLPLAD